MADQRKQALFPSALAQNPAPVGGDSQDRKTKVSAQVEEILAVFMQLVPSNYVSEVKGPHYLLRFQAIAEQIAEFQVTAQETFADSVYEFTRSEFLFQVLGALVFPDASSDGYPTIPGDISYRTFLQRMVTLLLQGATKANVEEGLGLLTTATVEVIEKALEARRLGAISGWGDDDAFTFEVNVSRVAQTISATDVYVPPGENPEDFGEVALVDLYGFPEEDPFVLQENVRLVLRALKPAHTLYDYRHLFQDAFGGAYRSASSSWSMTTYYYDDLRKYCLGVKQITGTGDTLTDRSLFSDPTRDFAQIRPGADLTVLTGPNSINAGGLEGTIASTDRVTLGRYRVQEVLVFPVGTDATPRAYTTSSGLSGTATVTNADLEDPLQNFGLALEGETLTLLAGPNAGTYRLRNLLGNYGGPVGLTTGPIGYSYTRVRAGSSLIRIEGRMPVVTTGQPYTVGVDRLGVQAPNTVTGEDVSVFFLR